MRPGTAWAAAALATLTLGCGGGASPTRVDVHGGAAGAGGQGGGVATGGQRGQGGSNGAGGAGDDLPACEIAQRPDDPANADGGANPVDPTSGACNTIETGGQPVASEMLDAVGGGAREDGGAIAAPSGGTILDGDYDFVRWEDLPGTSSIRRLRVFGGGTYVEWLVSNARGPGPDAGFASKWYDTVAGSSGSTLSLSYVCGDVLVTSYGYTARGDDLVLFDDGAAGPASGTLFSVDTFRRTCTRP